jgi:hypothetical protein
MSGVELVEGANEGIILCLGRLADLSASEVLLISLAGSIKSVEFFTSIVDIFLILGNVVDEVFLELGINSENLCLNTNECVQLIANL